MTNFIPELDLHKLTNAQLTDEIGRLDIMAKAFAKALEKAKDEFKGRKLTAVDGEKFSITIRTDIRWTLNTKAVKEEMGEKWYDKHSKSSAVSVMSIKANAGLVAETEAA